MISIRERELNMGEVLEYADGPLLFLATDEAENNYVCAFLRHTVKNTEYLCSKVGGSIFRKFIAGGIDLLRLIKEAPLVEYYLLQATGPEDPLVAHPISLGEVPENLLPEADYYVPMEIGSAILAEQRVIIDAALEIEESKKHPAISSYTLSDFLAVFQDLFKQAFKKDISTLDHKSRKAVSSPECYTTQVIGLGAFASFGLRLQSKQSADLFQHVEFERAITKAALILQETNIDKLLEVLQANQGPLIGAYKKLLAFLIESQASLRVRWHSPKGNERRFSISMEDAKTIQVFLSKQKELDDGVVEIAGILEAVNCRTGSWTLLDDKDVRYSGEIQKGLELKLRGLTTEDVRYVFRCQVETWEDALGGEHRKYFLLGHCPAPDDSPKT